MIQSPLDSRDYPYQILPRSQILNAHDLRIDDSVIEDQGNMQSCTAHATTAACEIFMARNLDFGNLSRQLVYYMARDAVGESNRQGANLREALSVLKNRGTCYEQDWPYTPQNEYTRPGDDVFAKIVGKISRYERLLGSGSALLESIKSAITEGFPVVIAMQVYPKFMRLRGTLFEQNMQTPYRGSFDLFAGVPLNHAMCVVGFASNRLILKNSWGPSWGDGGYGMIQPEAVGDIFEAWCVKGFAKDGADISTIASWLATKSDNDIRQMFPRLCDKQPRWWALNGLVRHFGGGRVGFDKTCQLLGFTHVADLNKFVMSI